MNGIHGYLLVFRDYSLSLFARQVNKFFFNVFFCSGQVIRRKITL
ncbi:hypothetical protein [Escherichia phage UPEC03]|nr:hypothetical protein [Escherichia phage UPEC03]